MDKDASKLWSERLFRLAFGSLIISIPSIVLVSLFVLVVSFCFLI